MTFGWDYYPVKHYWGFQNYSYIEFNQAINFTQTPHQGVPKVDNLVGQWNMNENLGSITFDSSGNSNNGNLLNSPTWVTGKFGNALRFNGSNYVEISNNASLQLTNDCSIFLWINPKVIGRECIIEKYWNNEFSLFLDSNHLEFQQGNPWQSKDSNIFQFQVGTWYNVGITRQNNVVTFYINGVAFGNANFTNTISSSNKPVRIGEDGDGSKARFNGLIDDVSLYSRALNANEVASLYAMGEQPDPISFDNYYTFTDSLTNNTLLIHVDGLNTNNNVTLLSCTNFFADNKIAFQANNSAIVNIWTNLGQPVFTTGFWNNYNYTTTLTLDDSSTSEMNWNMYNITTQADAHSSISPSNVTVGYGGSQSLSFNATQGYRFNISVDGVSQGQISSYTFSNVTGPHTVNVTSSLLQYTVSASADLGSTISPSGNVSVNYGGSQLFTVQNKDGYDVKHVYVDDVDKGLIFNYTFNNITNNHMICISSESLSSTNSSTPTLTPSPTPLFSPSSAPTATPTTVPSPSHRQITSPSLIQSSQQENNPYLIQSVIIAAAAIAASVTVFALAFNKGFITIEISDEQADKDETSNQDYAI